MQPTQTPKAMRLPLIALAAWVLILVGGCSRPLVLDQPLSRQIAEIGCISQCQATKDRCDDDARYDYQQCQAGYNSSLKDYRWCLSSSRSNCGYPWWSCSENHYGYCTNRYWECHNRCIGTNG